MGRGSKSGNRKSNGKKKSAIESLVVEEAPTACCICGEVDNEDLIILCDGKNCSKETHMYCIQPPLYEVPEGEWFCDTCDPKGTTKYLEEYFTIVQDIFNVFSPKESSENFRNYLEALLQNLLTTDSSINLGTFSPEAVLSNEFDSLSAVTSFEWIGRKLKLYCSVDKRVHAGRIIDFRRNEDALECLVQFKSGIDGRNSPFIVWLSPSEHACIVCGNVVWYEDAVYGWWPTQLGYRSALWLKILGHRALDPSKEVYIEFFHDSSVRVVDVTDEEECLPFRDHEPKNFKKSKVRT